MTDPNVQSRRIETLLRGINEARQLIDPIWREQMGAESVREHVQRGLRCIDSAVKDCGLTEPAPCEVCGAAPCGWCDSAPAQPEPPTAA